MHDTFLRFFDEVARQGSIRKAAGVLNVSSTSINRKIISTEERIGVRLFHRSPEGVKLTNAGSVVLEHCRQTLFDYDRVQLLIDDIRDMRSGHINILALDSIALGILPEALGRFSDSYPEITYSVATALPDEVVTGIRNEEADIGLSFCNDIQPDVRTLAEKSTPLGAVMLPNHPLAERSKLSVTDIASYAKVRSIDARGRNSIINHISSDEVDPLSAKIFTNSLPLAKQMILQGRGIGLYTKIGFLNEIEAGNLRFVPLDIEALSRLRIGVIVSSRIGMGPTKHLVCDELIRSLKAIKLDS
ncbi:MAG: LysR family transcriptional regulator [Stappiaceae bacterium]